MKFMYCGAQPKVFFVTNDERAAAKQSVRGQISKCRARLRSISAGRLSWGGEWRASAVCCGAQIGFLSLSAHAQISSCMSAVCPTRTTV
eukprot:6179053-Pleurochrysis_carterae.AAC.1